MRSFASTCVALIALSVPLLGYADGVSSWSATMQQLLSATRIANAQLSASSDKRSNAAMQAASAQASTAMDIFNRQQVRQTYKDYGPDGQLVDPCYQVGMASTATEITGKSSMSAMGASSRLYRIGVDGNANTGGVSGFLGQSKKVTSVPYTSSVATRLERHLSRYCSVSEAEAGLCTLNPNGMQSGDSDFSLHLTPGKTYGWDQTEAATDFVKTLAPVKPAPSSSQCTDVACRAALAERRQQEAYLSGARYSMLQFVEAHSTQQSGDAKTSAAK